MVSFVGVMVVVVMQMNLLERLMDDITYITATDTGYSYSDKNIARVLDFRNWLVLKCDVERFIEDEGKVLIVIVKYH